MERGHLVHAMMAGVMLVAYEARGVPHLRRKGQGMLTSLNPAARVGAA